MHALQHVRNSARPHVQSCVRGRNVARTGIDNGVDQLHRDGGGDDGHHHDGCVNDNNGEERIVPAYLVVALIEVLTHKFRPREIGSNPFAISRGYSWQWVVLMCSHVNVGCTFSSRNDGPLRDDAPSWCLAPFDPEGLLSSISTILSTTIGVHYGHVLVHYKNYSPVHIAAIPLNKQLYNINYVYFTAGLAVIVLSAFYWLQTEKGGSGTCSSSKHEGKKGEGPTASAKTKPAAVLGTVLHSRSNLDMWIIAHSSSCALRPHMRCLTHYLGETVPRAPSRAHQLPSNCLEPPVLRVAPPLAVRCVAPPLRMQRASLPGKAHGPTRRSVHA
ncbi:hypothetical protein KSP40_PGU001501 [Platanthera guangdongensis]|uniref:Uncharacterized protein n=1 Tax=Platanthera guangdongensis TaxID=2320717 RepID=A0ABR2M3P9_9ASPA